MGRTFSGEVSVDVYAVDSQAKDNTIFDTLNTLRLTLNDKGSMLVFQMEFQKSASLCCDHADGR